MAAYLFPRNPQAQIQILSILQLIQSFNFRRSTQNLSMLIDEQKVVIPRQNCLQMNYKNEYDNFYVIQQQYQYLYDAVNLINFMHKRATKSILQHLLIRSPHQSLQRINSLSSLSISPSSKIQDQSYTDVFLSNVQCEFLLTDQFSLAKTKPSQILYNSEKIQSFVLYAQKEENPSQNQIESKIINCVKKLHEQKHHFITYVEAEDILLSIKSSELSGLKKYLIFIYRWTLSQQGKLTEQIDLFCQRLKRIVVAKLGEAYTQEQYKKEIKEQLEKVKILSKAREYSRKGNKQKAKKYYQKIFDRKIIDEHIKMQALEYLCKESQKDQDLSYLLGMRIKIKQNSISEEVKLKHMEYLEYFLCKVTLKSKSQTFLKHLY